MFLLLVDSIPNFGGKKDDSEGHSGRKSDNENDLSYEPPGEEPCNVNEEDETYEATPWLILYDSKDLLEMGASLQDSSNHEHKENDACNEQNERQEIKFIS